MPLSNVPGMFQVPAPSLFNNKELVTCHTNVVSCKGFTVNDSFYVSLPSFRAACCGVSLAQRTAPAAYDRSTSTHSSWLSRKNIKDSVLCLLLSNWTGSSKNCSGLLLSHRVSHRASRHSRMYDVCRLLLVELQNFLMAPPSNPTER